MDNEKEWQKQHVILKEEVIRLTSQNQRLHEHPMNNSFINQSLEKTFLLQPIGVSSHMST